MNRLVITDRTADIPVGTAEEYGIEVLPVNVVLDGKRYRDRVEISIEDFYANYDKWFFLSSRERVGVRVKNA